VAGEREIEAEPGLGLALAGDLVLHAAARFGQQQVGLAVDLLRIVAQRDEARIVRDGLAQGLKRMLQVVGRAVQRRGGGDHVVVGSGILGRVERFGEHRHRLVIALDMVDE